MRSTASPSPHPGEIVGHFDRIARRYDRANRLLSLGNDRRWRRRLAGEARPAPGTRLLDVCTGTADVLITFGKHCPGLHLVGLDRSAPMLEVGRKKLRRLGLSGVGLCRGDALTLPFRAGVFDRVTIAFGLRNLPDWPQALGEMRRVLRPGGHLLILEFGWPIRPPLQPLYGFYLRRVLPVLGGWLTGWRAPYDYFRDSVLNSAPPQRIREELERAGFAEAQMRALTWGIALLYHARAPGPANAALPPGADRRTPAPDGDGPR